MSASAESTPAAPVPRVTRLRRLLLNAVAVVAALLIVPAATARLLVR